MGSSQVVAQDTSGQLIELEDGTTVRYFTVEQLRELADRIAEGEQCEEENTLLERMVDNLEDQNENLRDSHDLLYGELEAMSEYAAELNESIDEAIERMDRGFFFCRSHACSYAVGLTFGVGLTAIVVFAVR